MRKPKLFFSEDSEFCHSLDYYREEVGNIGIILTEAVQTRGSDFFYCSEFNLCGDKSEGGCGTLCKGYEPRNGKNGRCRFSKNCYEAGSRKFKLTKNGLEELK